MSKLADVVAYLAEHYPHKNELSKARLTKMVYLADWEAVKRTGNQITPIRWYFHNFGPYVDDVVDVARNDRRLKLFSTMNAYGDLKEQIKFQGMPNLDYQIPEIEKRIIDDVIEKTKSMYWRPFIAHVYSTPPIKKSQRYTYLDLKEFR